MRSKLLFVIVLILAMTALPATVFANLAVNEGYEDGTGYPDNWAEWSTGVSYGGDGTTNYREAEGVARTGSDCMEATGAEYAYSYQDFAGVIVGQDYTVAAYFKDIHSGGSTSQVQLQMEYRDGPRGSGETTFLVEGYETAIPNDGNWHLVQLTYTTPANTELITICVGKDGTGAGTYLYDDAWFDTIPPGGAHSPDPPNNSKVQAPGLVDLKWENVSAQTCTVYWDDGSADVNDLNFQHNVDYHLGTKVYNIGTVTSSDPNEVLNKVIADGKVYHWRVDVGSLPGIVWNFSTINSAPDVDAGPKQAMWQDGVPNPVTFQLAPTVSDDGLPIPPNTVYYYWTQIAGPLSPNGVIFNPGTPFTSTSLAPTATMSVLGDYTLQLEVSDGVQPPAPTVPPALNTTDPVVLRVHANITTGLEARYDLDEGAAANQAHDDFSTNARHADRMADGEVQTGTAEAFTGTTFDTTGGHCDDGNGPNVGAMVFHPDIPGYLQAKDSGNDPNFQAAGWADFRDEVTLAAWIKVDTENGGWDDSWECVINKGENSYRLHRNAGSDSIQMTINIDESESIAAGTTPVNDGGWHHVMGTYDGAEVCIYIDGLLEGECTPAEGQIDWPVYEGDDPDYDRGPDLTFGYSLQSDAPFGGTMDEVRVHSIGLPHASDKPEAAPLTALNARSVISIYRTSCGHPNCGGVYFPGDADEDCYVDLNDAKLMAQHWLECNDIGNASCIP